MVKLQSVEEMPSVSAEHPNRPAEVQGRSLFVSDYDVRGRNYRVLAWILT